MYVYVHLSLTWEDEGFYQIKKKTPANNAEKGYSGGIRKRGKQNGGVLSPF